jgi:DNA-binding XRE family transcriptional regulator
MLDSELAAVSVDSFLATDSSPRRPVDPQKVHGMEGKQLKEQRLALGLTQVEFGKILGVSRYTIARSERGPVSENVAMRMELASKKLRKKQKRNK